MIDFIRTQAPQLLDPSLPSFPGKSAYIGDQVRIKVPLLEGDEAWRQKVDAARQDAKLRYPGAAIIALPDFRESLEQTEASPEVAIATTDDERLYKYLAATLPQALRPIREKVYAYLLAKLRAAEGASNLYATGTEFVSVSGKNVLSFEEVELDLSKPGIRLVLGENRDWANTSNGCLAKGTLIDCPRDLSKSPLGVPIEELVGKRPYLYSYDERLRRIVLKRSLWVRKTGTDVPVVKIKFREPFGDPSKVVRRSYRVQNKRGRRITPTTELTLTADHLVLLRKGGWKRAGDLVPGDRIMPFYRRSSDGSYWSLNLNNGQQVTEQRFILSELYGARPASKWHAHHKDENRSNNSVRNLVWLPKSRHISLHTKQLHAQRKFGWQYTGSPHPRGMLGKNHKPSIKRQISISMKRRSKDPVYIRHFARGMLRARRAALKRSGLLGKQRLLTRLYVGEGLSQRRIEKQLGCEPGRVQVALRFYDIRRNHVVVSVEPAGKSDVYDICVPGTENFIANGVVVHNSGKSALLQLLRVAAFGSTSKGQDHDRLILRHSERLDACLVEMRFRGRNGVLGEVLRGRRPMILKLALNGRDRSSGRNQQFADSTQDLIERTIGMRPEAFDHSVLIDQTLLHRAHAFLNGTDKDRKELLAQFLHLERFGRAADEVRQSKIRWRAELENARSNCDWIENRVAELCTELNEVTESAIIAQAQGRIATLQDELAVLDFDSQYWDNLSKEEDRLDSLVGELDGDIRNLSLDLQADKETIQVLEREIRIWQSGERSKCSQCGQSLPPNRIKKQIADLKTSIGQREGKVRKTELTLVAKRRILSKTQKQYEGTRAMRIKLDRDKTRHDTLTAQIRALEEQLRTSPMGQLQKGLELKIKYFQRLKKIFVLAFRDLTAREPFYDYCELAMSRQGIVNYLYAQVCSQLNAAAKFYSDIFTGGILQLRFHPVEKLKSGAYSDRLSIQVINTQGGEQPEDQSRGEEQLIAFMCVLCLREVGPKSNLLILDEPAEGLDPINARRLADGLKRLTDRIPCILLATHSDVLKGEFRDGQALWVVKENGVSRLEWT